VQTKDVSHMAGLVTGAMTALTYPMKQLNFAVRMRVANRFDF